MSTAALIGGLSAGFSGLTSLGNLGMGIANYYQQEKAMNQNQQNMETNWNREDNSVQRRVNDLQQAGMSPTLAAGQGASAGNLTTLHAPQMQADISNNPVSTFVETQQRLAQTEYQQNLSNVSKEEVKLKNSQTQKTLADTLRTIRETGLLDTKQLQMAANTSLQETQRLLAQENITLTKERTNEIKTHSRLLNAQVLHTNEDTLLKRQQAMTESERTELMSFEKQLTQSQISKISQDIEIAQRNNDFGALEKTLGSLGASANIVKTIMSIIKMFK